ncbi:hypothetical protein G6F59_017664 [Rhizopus arrhizus]|nr:hypothetical protein G6F59_017664 [Rhizopus arrhizus]
MLLSFSIEGIVVVGMTLLVIVGGSDLSVGSVVCMAMVITGKLFLMGVDPWTASLAAIAASGVVGALIGLCVTRIGLSHFIAARRSRCSRYRRSSSSSARASSGASPPSS